MAKKLTKAIDLEAMTVTLTVVGKEPLVVNVAELDQGIQRHAILHGLSQKIGDAAAGKDPEDSFASMSDVIVRLEKGGENAWNAAREAGAGPSATMLAQAIVRVGAERGKTVELADVVEQLSNAGDEQKKAMRANPAIKAAMSAIKAERDAEKADKAAESGDDGLDAIFG